MAKHSSRLTIRLNIGFCPFRSGKTEKNYKLYHNTTFLEKQQKTGVKSCGIWRKWLDEQPGPFDKRDFFIIMYYREFMDTREQFRRDNYV